MAELETPKEGEDKDLLAEAKERYKLCADAWAENRKAWLDDAKFRAGDQWPEAIKKKREDADRPCVVVDKLNQYVRQVVNDGRQNRPGVKVRPEGDGAHEDAAEAWEDFIRGICARSNADEAYDTSLDHAAGNGYGYFRVITDYAHPGTFNQEIKIKRVRNPRSVMLDPFIQEADASDARFGFVEEDVPKDDFKKQYPQAKATDWTRDSATYGEGWLTDKSVRVCEYWYKVETPELVHLLDNGETMSDEDYQLGIKNGVQDMPKVVDTRTLPVCEVKFCRMTGAEILEKKDWQGKYIPLLLVMGNESDIDGKVTYSGLIRSAKDPQRLYNYARSAYAERVALTPKAPFVAATGQVEGHPEWEDANTENYSVLVYDPVDNAPPPQRQNPSDIPAGFAQDMQLSEHDIQGAMGMYNSSLGEKSNEKSGKAIMARQREGDTGTFHYPDNLNRAIRYMGRIIVDLAPHIYDSRRMIYLLGEDGTLSTAQIDPEQQQAVQELAGKKIYNLGIGLYGVDIAAGPSYTTKRQEAAEAMMQLSQANPAILQVAGDLMVRNMDWPGAEAIADRLKLALPPQIAQAEQAKDQGQDPKIQAAVAPLKQGLDQAHQQIQQAEQGIQQRDQAMQQQQQELAALKADRQAAMLKAQTDQYNAETTRMKVAAEAQNKPQDTAGVEQAKNNLEVLRLEYEDRWKKLEADTQVITTAITAQKSAEAATATANAQGVEASPVESVEAPEVDTNAAILAALQGFTEAVSGMTQATMRPKTIVRDDNGRVSGIQ